MKQGMSEEARPFLLLELAGFLRTCDLSGECLERPTADAGRTGEGGAGLGQLPGQGGMDSGPPHTAWPPGVDGKVGVCP